MDVFALFEAHVRAALAAEGAITGVADPAGITVETAREPGRGDLTTTAAMAFAAASGLPPRDLAERLAARLARLPGVTRAEAAGPGFVNLSLAPAVWADVLAAILAAGNAYGRSAAAPGGAARVGRVEPEAIGLLDPDHGRQAVLADALAGLLEAAGRVVRRVPMVDGPRKARTCGPVRVLSRGRPLGGVPSFGALAEEAGWDAVRFAVLSVPDEAPLALDLAALVDLSWDNPLFRVHYAHARCRSAFRAARETAAGLADRDALRSADFALLVDERETMLLKRLARYPRLIGEAAAVHRPHRVAFYLGEFADDFHAYWNWGRNTPDLRFIRDESGSLTRARLALVLGVETVLASGLALLGVSAPDELR